MKRLMTTMLAAGFILAAFQYASGQAVRIARPKPKAPDIAVKKLTLKGEIIDDDNISFDLSFNVDAREPGEIPIVSGEISGKGAEISGGGFSFIPWGHEEFSLIPRGGSYLLKCPEKGERDVKFSFFSKVEKRNASRSTSFSLPSAVSRTVEITAPRKDIELTIPGALNVVKKDAPDGKGVVFTAALPPRGNFKLDWRSQVSDLHSALVVSVSPVVMHTALPGAISTTNVFRYNVIQGKLSEITLGVSPGMNILAVKGEDIQDWNVEGNGGKRELRVKLGREFDSGYTLVVSAEKILPKFPCEFSLPRLTPENVLRVDGYLSVSAASGVKLVVEDTSGVTQIDPKALPRPREIKRPLPSRDLYAYKFAGKEYSIKGAADNVSPSYSAEIIQVAMFKDEEIKARSNITLDVKDAAIRELTVEYPADLAVNRVSGRFVQGDDYDTIPPDKPGDPAKLKIPFRRGAIGKITLSIEFEKAIKSSKKLHIPTVRIENARSVRGYLLLASDRGISITAANTSGMRKIHPSLAPFKVRGLKLAFKFKGQEWKGDAVIAKQKTAIAENIFHLASIGDASVYGSSLIGYRISGAPVDTLDVVLDNSYKNPEFTGDSIIDWKKTGTAKNATTWRVKFKTKLFGDHEMLVTYETPLPRSGAAEYKVGGVYIATSDATSGFMAVASARNLKITNKSLDKSVSEVEASELTKEYRDSVHNPILKAYKFNKTPAIATTTITSYNAVRFVDAAVEYAELKTRIDANGEIVTDAEYRLKNASRQFLSVKLPPKAHLWTVEVDGARKRVSESKNGEGVYLVPIPRKKDTDKIIAVSLTYATKLEDKLGAAADIPMRAPVLDIDTLGLAWTISIPEKYDFTSFEGDMIPRRSPRISGLSGLYSMMALWLSALSSSGAAFPFVAFLLCVATSAYAWGRGKLKIFLTFASVVGFFFAASWFLECLGDIHIQSLTPPRVNTADFAKAFVPANAPATLNLAVQALNESSILGMLGIIVKLLLAGIALMFASRKRSALLAGLGATFILWAFSYWLSFNAAVAIFLPTAVCATLAIVVWSAVFTRARTKALAELAKLAKNNAAAVVAATVVLLGLSAPNASAADNGAPAIVVETADYDVSASDESVVAKAKFTVRADAIGEIPIVKGPAAITGDLPDISGIEIQRRGNDCYLKAKSTGSYEFELELQLPKKAPRKGVFVFTLPIPECLKNKVRVNVSGNFDISSSNAVFFKKEGGAAAVASFVPGAKATFKLSPKEREASSETLRLFANITSSAKFAAGVVEIRNSINLRIAQGQMSKLTVKIPDGMNVVNVLTRDLAAWKFNPDDKSVDIFFSRPQKDSSMVFLETQIPNRGLPYECSVGALSVAGAEEQHGTLSLTAAADVQIRVLATSALNRLNTADIGKGVRKAFKYFKPPAAAKVKAIPVTPEIRAEERSTVSFEEERTLIISDFTVAISKAGLFSISVKIPDGFDVDKVVGDSIRDWDEISKNGKTLVVRFARKVLGGTRVHIEASSEKEFPANVEIPAFRIVNAKKTKGSLVVKFERGTRMDIRERRGIEVASTDNFSRVRGGGSETRRLFNILRPDWKLAVSFETAAPWVQADSLQSATISDGALNRLAWFRFKIENAGVKRLEFKLPKGAESPEFIGPDILASFKADSGNWVVALKRKAFSNYSLKIKFREPLDSMKNVVIRPVKALGVELQKGFMVVSAKDAFRMAKTTPEGDMTPFDPRKIPAKFNAGNLSDALLCYRTVGAAYQLSLKLEHDKAAKLLRAKINAVDLETVASLEGNIITKARIYLVNIGNENFLKMTLPPKSRVWSATIDRNPQVFNPGQSVEVARDGEKILVPLKQKSDTEQVVEIIYSTPKPPNWRWKSQAYFGPSFELPLNNIQWSLHMPMKYTYRKFDGTLEYVDTRFIPLPPPSVEEYDRTAAQRSNVKRRMSKSWLSKANIAAKRGKFKEANDYFSNASNLAADDQALQEDVQGQWKEAQRVVTNNMRQLQVHLPTSNQPLRMTQRPQQTALNSISDKIFEQQIAAGRKTGALIFSIPQAGRKLEFARALQMDGATPMQVEFAATPAFSWESHSGFYAGVVLTLVMAAALRLLIAVRKRWKKLLEAA